MSKSSFSSTSFSGSDHPIPPLLTLIPPFSERSDIGEGMEDLIGDLKSNETQSNESQVNETGDGMKGDGKKMERRWEG